MVYVKDQEKLNTNYGLFNNTSNDEVFLQFVPGRVEKVFTNLESDAISESDVNSIMAYTEYGDNLPIKSGNLSQYFPLLRGIVDVPDKKDMVLLININGKGYYLGPINVNQSPNRNIYELSNIDTLPAEYNSDVNSDITIDKNKDLYVARLSKTNNKKLDESIGGILGDMLLEGKHGNSIRIGSRGTNPYMFFSNGRNFENDVESLNDGSTIAITENGSIRKHFQYDAASNEGELSYSPFLLASDKIPEDNVNNNVNLIGDSYNYDYMDNQVLVNSDRITINSKGDSIFLSSFADTTISSGNNIKIQSNSNTTINANSIFIGNDEKTGTPLVRGTILVEIINDMLSLMRSATVAAPAPQPVLWGGIPTNPPGVAEGKNMSLDNISTKLNKILSDIGFIELENRG
jgi:hypothetical protein